MWPCCARITRIVEPISRRCAAVLRRVSVFLCLLIGVAGATTACASAEAMVSGLAALGQGAERRVYVSPDAAYAFEHQATALVQMSEDASQPYVMVFVQFDVTDTASYQGASIQTLAGEAAAQRLPMGEAHVEYVAGASGSGVVHRIALYGGGKGGASEPSPQAWAQYALLTTTFRLLDEPLRARAVRVPAAAAAVAAIDPAIAAQFTYPMRDADGVRYGVPVGWTQHRTQMEHLGYAVRNLDQWRIKCYAVDWSRMLHAGEDWYRLDGANTAGAPVYAVADGVVVQHNPGLSYPGNVVVIRHRLADGSDVYSMYGHVTNVRVVVGDRVTMGEQIAAIFNQGYRGRTPDRHPTWDSHLHFEIRRRADMGNIYEAGSNAYGYDFPACTWLYPGRGYTLRVHPDAYPYPGDGYLEPSAFIAARAARAAAVPGVLGNITTPAIAYGLSLVNPSKRGIPSPEGGGNAAFRGFLEATTAAVESSLQTSDAPRAAPPATVQAATAEAGRRVLIPLVAQSSGPACANVLRNGGFEEDAEWAGIANTARAVYDEPVYTAEHARSGARSGRVGSPTIDGYWNEFVQTAAIPAGTTRLTLRFWRRLETRETSTSRVYDAFRVGVESERGVEAIAPLRIDNASPGRREWVQEELHLADAAALAGRSVWVTFKGATDDTLSSSLYVDDVELEACS